MQSKLLVGSEYLPFEAHLPKQLADTASVYVVGGQRKRKYEHQDPFQSGMDGRARRMIEKYGESVSYTYAVDTPGPLSETYAEDNRPRVAAGVPEGVDRILLLGKQAQEVFLGRAYNPTISRKGYVVSPYYLGAAIFILPDPNDVVDNTIAKRWFAEDLRWAMTVDLESLYGPPTECRMLVIETPEDAQEAYEELRVGPIDYDTETYGKMFNKDFKAVCLAVCSLGSDDAYVWPEDAMLPGDPRREPLVKLLNEVPVWGHGVKYDLKTVHQYLGADPVVGGCTQTAAKMQKADGGAQLDLASNMVGMGSHKSEAKQAEAKAVQVLNALRKAADKDVVTDWDKVEKVDKRGRKYKRKVAAASRPPAESERAEQAEAAWKKSRTINKQKTTYAELMGYSKDDSIPEDWLHAAMQTGDPKQYIFGLIPRDICHRYCALDTIASGRLAQLVTEKFEEEHYQPIEKVYTTIMVPVIPAVKRMEERGMLVDMERLDAFEKVLDEDLTKALADIHEYAPGLNPASPKQKAEYLFGPKSKGGLGLPVLETTAQDAPSASSSVLSRLVDEHPVIGALLTYAKCDKLQSNYARGLRDHIREDGRVHCNINLTGTATGRFSHTDPNMSTIPSPTREPYYAKMAKDLFVAPPGWVLVQADFSTLEVRIAAMLSGDKDMIELLNSGVDFHKETARSMTKVIWGDDFETCSMGYTLDQVLSEYGGDQEKAEEDERWKKLAAEQKRRRGVSKTTVFGTLYGQGPASLAKRAGCTEEEAAAAQEALLRSRFKDLGRWVDNTIKQAHREGGTWTWWNGQKARFRPILDLGYPDSKRRGHGERASYNTPVQGTGSEFNIASNVAVDRWIRESGVEAHLLMSVHDSLVGECEKSELEEVGYNMHRIMTSHNSLNVITPVDLESGLSWGSLSELEIAT